MHLLPVSILFALTAIVLPLGGMGCAPSAGGGGNTITETKLTAQFASGNLIAEVNAVDRVDQTRLEVNIQGGTPNAVIDITINGVVVAMVTLDANGSAQVQYSSRPDNTTGELPLPVAFNFPSTGDVVTIGAASGQFQDDDDDDGTNGNDDNGNDDNGNDDNSNDDNGDNANSNDNDDNTNVNDNDDNTNVNDNGGNSNDNGDDDSPILELKADIAAPTFTARIDYEIESDRVHLRFQVSNGIPGNTITVDVAGFALEEITLDFSGNADVEYSDQPRAGEVLLPFGFRTLREGDTVSMTGSLAFFVLDES